MTIKFGRSIPSFGRAFVTAYRNFSAVRHFALAATVRRYGPILKCLGKRSGRLGISTTNRYQIWPPPPRLCPYSRDPGAPRPAACLWRGNGNYSHSVLARNDTMQEWTRLRRFFWRDETPWHVVALHERRLVLGGRIA